MNACGYKKLWELYEINLNDDWCLQTVARTIFGCSGTHFWTIGTNREWFAIQDRRFHHRVSHQIFLTDEALLRKFLIVENR